MDGQVYLMLANELSHEIFPGAVTIAEDVSGMPTLCRRVDEGGIGFDFRLSMFLPDMVSLFHSVNFQCLLSIIILNS